MSAELETFILGSCLSATECYVAACAAGVTEAHFAGNAERTVWLACRAAYASTGQSDLGTVAATNCGVPQSDLIRIAAAGSGLSHIIPSKARDLIDSCKQREVAAILGRAAMLAKSGDWSETWPNLLADLNRVQSIATDTQARTWAQIVESFISQTEQPERRLEISTGMPVVDRRFGQLLAGELITIAGRPGGGKSALGVSIGVDAAAAGHRSLIVSAEMSGEEIVGRLVARLGGKESLGSKQAAIREAKRLLKLRTLTVLDSSKRHSIESIEAAARSQASQQGGLGIVVVDYIGLIEPENSRDVREQQISKMTRRLKQLAGSLKCVVVMLAQMNRDIEKEGKPRLPRLSDLRESGSIEQDSNRVWFISDDHQWLETQPGGELPDTIQVILLQAKCRGGKPAVAQRLTFDRPLFRLTPTAETSSWRAHDTD